MFPTMLKPNLRLCILHRALFHEPNNLVWRSFVFRLFHMPFSFCGF